MKGFSMHKLSIMYFLVARVAVAVSAIMWTVSGIMLRTSLRCENSFLNVSPLQGVQL